MTKEEALRMIDEHKNKLVNPIEMLAWTWLRVMILKVPDNVWRQMVAEATDELGR